MVGRQSLKVLWDIGDEQNTGIANRIVTTRDHLEGKQSSVII
jgi:hypothetical protein